MAQTRPEAGRPRPPGLEVPRPDRGRRHPLALSLTSGNRHDITELLPLIDKIPPVRNRRGRPRQRPDQLFADRAYDHDKYRKAVRGKGIRARIARRGQSHGSGLGVFRWVVERTLPGTTA